MDGTLVMAPVRGQSWCLEAEALGRQPTDRGRCGRKIHRPMDQHGIPLGVALVGAHVHDSRWVSSTLVADRLPRPEPTADHPQHLCLDKGYDSSRVEQEALDPTYRPPIRRMGEEKLREGEKNPSGPPLGGRTDDRLVERVSGDSYPLLPSCQEFPRHDPFGLRTDSL
jgi:putative transposase